MADSTPQPVPAAPAPPETITVDTPTVGCDGGGALGHPLVYLNLGAGGTVDCPYCDRRFVLRKGARPSGH
ncbi:MAG: zinc-finger domain-containing protein [Rhodospirillales bacterium]|nr:zinc-finger domain-containing protein [Rhodospirillales bacterium]